MFHRNMAERNIQVHKQPKTRSSVINKWIKKNN